MKFKSQVKPIHVAVASSLTIVVILATLSRLLKSDPTLHEVVKISAFVVLCVGIYINFRIAIWQWREVVREINAELKKDA